MTLDGEAHRVHEVAAPYLARSAALPVHSLGRVPGTACEVLAILGGGHAGASFKDLLGLGTVVLAREYGHLRAGQPIAESTSGSMGLGISWAGRLLGHETVLVTDPNIPAVTRGKIELLGARLVEVGEPDAATGWQGAREARIDELLRDRPELFFVNQNDNELNPMVHTRWLVPKLEKQISPSDVSAAVFVVGSGGHFSALSRWLSAGNPSARSYAADRPGSLTFGPTPPAAWRIRGVGNTTRVPGVMAKALDLVDDVFLVGEEEALMSVRHLALECNLFVGASSGLAYAAACKLARRMKSGRILTLFPDRGELYFDLYRETILHEDWTALQRQQWSWAGA